MSKILDVFLYDTCVGKYNQDRQGSINFTYAQSYLDYDLAMPLSNSLPLRSEKFVEKECNFFSGLLPEEGPRKIIARNLGISANNDFSLLEKIGGECAGAITFLPENASAKESTNDYHVISNIELVKILQELPNNPLLVGYKNMRLSLAGAQDKFAVAIKNGELCLPLFGAPSTHILKPTIPRFQGSVFNEAFCLTLAKLIGLPAANVSIGVAGDTNYLLVERYDRQGQQPAIERVHQEDFCQALGIAPGRKYQAEGGPSVKQSFELTKKISSTAIIDLRNLLEMMIFNWLIGNCDAHGKNFSLLYSRPKNNQPSSTKLAPAYDMLCTIVYPELSTKMAMKFGSEYNAIKIQQKYIERFAEDTGLSKTLVIQRILELSQLVKDTLGEVKIQHKITDTISEIVSKRCSEVIRRLS